MSGINIILLWTIFTVVVAFIAAAWVSHRSLRECMRDCAPAICMFIAIIAPEYFLPDSAPKGQRTVLSLLIYLVVWTGYLVITKWVKHRRKTVA